MYWHMVKSLKAAVKEQNIEIVAFILEDLDMPLKHEAFDRYLHAFLFSCKNMTSELDIECSTHIFRYLVKGFGKGNLDGMDDSGSTALSVCCELLTNLSMVETLIEKGEADVNCVNNDGMLPLGIVKQRLKADPENDDLQDIYEYLKRKGAVRDWRKAK